MQQVYQKDTAEASAALATLFEAHSEAMTPLLNIVVEAKMTLDAFIDVVGRSCLEAVLQLSAAEIAGPPQQGKAGGEVQWHGTQEGVITLPTQKVRVRKPLPLYHRWVEGAAVSDHGGVRGGHTGATLPPPQGRKCGRLPAE